MNQYIVLSPDAKADIDSAVLWYRRIDPNLAVRYTAETLATLHRIKQFPYRFPIITSSVRRALLKRFPYYIYYSFVSSRVSVIAVVHHRRPDSVWMNRGIG
jgi:plasmid stabilization system protein ParE